MRARVTGLVVVLALLALVPAHATTTTDVPTPTLATPPAGLRGYPLWDSYYDLRPFGYEEHEYLVSGTARNSNGAPAAYTTRIIVTRPSTAPRFNGTVVLDWVNVTAQFENAVDTMEAREMLMREGFAYVHVSAQSAGICCTPLTPKMWDPVRYAALNHPGDDFAADMFTQIAQLFRRGPLRDGVREVLAVGQSQSGFRLYSYINGWLPAHPEAVGLIDGFLVHGAAEATKQFNHPLPQNVKVLQLLSDREAVPGPVTTDPNYRLWEVAGTAHSDFFIGYQSEFGHGPRVLGGKPKIDPATYRDIIDKAGDYGERIDPLLATCTLAGATMPMHYSTSAAIHWLNQWSRPAAGGDGLAPPNGPRYELDASGQLARDQYGNAKGGIRLPPIDVPVASYQSTLCNLGGVTVPFPDLVLQQLYPTFADYQARMQSRTAAAVRAGWLLPEDGADLLRRVCLARARWGEQPTSCPAAA